VEKRYHAAWLHLRGVLHVPRFSHRRGVEALINRLRLAS